MDIVGGTEHAPVLAENTARWCPCLLWSPVVTDWNCLSKLGLSLMLTCMPCTCSHALVESASKDASVHMLDQESTACKAGQHLSQGCTAVQDVQLPGKRACDHKVGICPQEAAGSHGTAEHECAHLHTSQKSTSAAKSCITLLADFWLAIYSQIIDCL